MYQARTYREWVSASGLVSFNVTIRQSDLMIRARRDLRRQAETILERVRADIEAEVARNPAFRDSLSPLPLPPFAAPVIESMLRAGAAFDVGPMAAVAGAVAQVVGQGLERWSPEVIVENGGDIYLRTDRPVEIGLYAGEDSPYSGGLRLRVDPKGRGIGLCTSSGTVGHSLSFGVSDAVVVLADDAAFADAAATAVGNRITSPDAVAAVLEDERRRARLRGLLVTVGKRMGAWGEMEVF